MSGNYCGVTAEEVRALLSKIPDNPGPLLANCIEPKNAKILTFSQNYELMTAIEVIRDERLWVNPRLHDHFANLKKSGELTPELLIASVGNMIALVVDEKIPSGEGPIVVRLALATMCYLLPHESQDYLQHFRLQSEDTLEDCMVDQLVAECTVTKASEPERISLGIVHAMLALYALGCCRVCDALDEDIQAKYDAFVQHLHVPEASTISATTYSKTIKDIWLKNMGQRGTIMTYLLATQVDALHSAASLCRELFRLFEYIGMKRAGVILRDLLPAHPALRLLPAAYYDMRIIKSFEDSAKEGIDVRYLSVAGTGIAMSSEQTKLTFLLPLAAAIAKLSGVCVRTYIPLNDHKKACFQAMAKHLQMLDKDPSYDAIRNTRAALGPLQVAYNEAFGIPGSSSLP